MNDCVLLIGTKRQQAKEARNIWLAHPLETATGMSQMCGFSSTQGDCHLGRPGAGGPGFSALIPTLHHYIEELLRCAQYRLESTSSHIIFVTLHRPVWEIIFIHILAKRKPRPDSSCQHSWGVAASALNAG